MKYLLAIISTLIITILVIIITSNSATPIALTIPVISLTIFTNSLIYIAGIMTLSFGAGLLLGGAFIINQKNKINPYKRQLEKLSVVKDSSESRVEVLEAKIKTLEAALQKSLENK